MYISTVSTAEVAPGRGQSSFDSIRGFAHAAGLATVRRCLRFLVTSFVRGCVNISMLLFVSFRECRVADELC